MPAHAIRKFWRKRFFRFLVVGGVNTVFGYSVFALLIFLGVHYSVAVLLSTITGVLFNFITTGGIVFENRDSSLLLRFFCVYFGTYLLNVGLLKILGIVGMSMYLAGALLLLPIAIVSFVLNKVFVFARGGE